jgi:hypothetical protein
MTDHVFALNTRIDKQTKQTNSKVFSSFDDFKKAFDTAFESGRRACYTN